MSVSDARWTIPPWFHTLLLMGQFVSPYFFSGVGSALELFPLPMRTTNVWRGGGMTDAQKLASDWYRVGWAIYSAIGSPDLETLIVEGRSAPEA